MISHVTAAAGDLFPLPDRNYMTTGGYVLLGALALATKIILGRMRQVVDLARVAIEAIPSKQTMDTLQADAKTAASESQAAKQYAAPTGNGFATAVLNQLGELQTSTASHHTEAMLALSELAHRVEKLEKETS